MRDYSALLRSRLGQGALRAGRECAHRNCESGRATVDEVCEWAVGAALRWLVDQRFESPPEPRNSGGGGNVHESGPTALGGPAEVVTEKAKLMGYTGDACKDCGNMAMVRNGTCLKCTVCGATSGCS